MTTMEEERAEDLRRAIIAAHEAGDHDRLRRLQEKFRSGGHSVERISKEPIRLVERGPVVSAPARSPGVATPLLGHRLAAEEVVISAEAWRDLSEQVRLDGLEEAGWLFGHHRGQQIRVEAVVLADQARTGSRVELDLAVLERMTEHYRRGPGWQPVGDFHSHVGAGYSNPSGNDRYAWRHAADRTNAAWLGLLLTPRSTWTLESTFDHGPAVDAYLTATGASETRRARLILET